MRTHSGTHATQALSVARQRVTALVQYSCVVTVCSSANASPIRPRRSVLPASRDRAEGLADLNRVAIYATAPHQPRAGPATALRTPPRAIALLSSWSSASRSLRTKGSLAARVCRPRRPSLLGQTLTMVVETARPACPRTTYACAQRASLLFERRTRRPDAAGRQDLRSSDPGAASSRSVCPSSSGLHSPCGRVRTRYYDCAAWRSIWGLVSSKRSSVFRTPRVAG